MSNRASDIPMTLPPGDRCPILPVTLRNNPVWTNFWRNVISRRMAA